MSVRIEEAPKRYAHFEVSPDQVHPGGDTYVLSPADAEWYKRNVKCQWACPVHTDVPGYIALIAEGKYAEAYAVNRRDNILPGILGRVCSHPCQTACRACDVDEWIAICSLKRAAADWKENWKPMTSKPWRKEKIAVVGAGPAGLAVANDLAIWGFPVTIFEASPVPSGACWLGIPEFRLSRDVIEFDVDQVKALGVEIRYNTPIGKNITMDDLLADYDRIVLAAGCYIGLRARIPGEDLVGSWDGITFLERVNLYKPTEIGKHVVTIGGGYTAMDCSRSVLRLGAETSTVLYRRTQKEMLVDDIERGDTMEEGVHFEFLVSPLEILGDENGHVKGIKCIHNRLGEPDASGRRSPVPIEGSEFVIDCDMVIGALGQAPLNDFLPDHLGIEINRGAVKVGENYRTTNPRIYAAGDYVTGPKTIIEAISHGRKAARWIYEDLTGQEMPAGKATITTLPIPFQRELGYDTIPHERVPALPVHERVKDFRLEWEEGYSKQQAYTQAVRCYQCQMNIFIDGPKCILCGGCVDICPYSCISMVPLEKTEADALTEPALAEAQGWEKGATMLIDETSCIRCGLCINRCPTHCISMGRFELEYATPAGGGRDLY
jgi:NADPH-dependent glutamate synthase beta subunit-like oxidoreductase